MAEKYFRNVSNDLDEVTLAAILNGIDVKAVSPMLVPSKAGVPDYEFVNGARAVVKAGEDIVFFDPTLAYVGDNMPTIVVNGKGEKGFAIRIPVYQREQYVTLLPGEDITITTDDAIAEKFYDDVYKAFTATKFGAAVVTNTPDASV